jgi:hypothetical protein
MGKPPVGVGGLEAAASETQCGVAPGRSAEAG